MKLIYSIFLGIKRHPLKFISEIFLSYSVFWTIIDSGAYFFSGIELQGIVFYALLVFISTLVACIRAYQIDSISFTVGHSNTTITILFADIFARDGYIAIPVNEYFDSEIGLPVSPNSLHGIVLNKFFGGHPAAFDQLVATDLANTSGQSVQRFGSSKTCRYPIGTTAFIKTNTHKFLLFALSTTDITTFKASATVPELVHAIEGLCAKARVTLGGERLIIPLVGSGLSGVGLPSSQLLQLLLLVISNETKKNKITSNIEIVIHSDRFDEIDLNSIKKSWE